MIDRRFFLNKLSSRTRKRPADGRFHTAQAILFMSIAALRLNGSHAKPVVLREKCLSPSSNAQVKSMENAFLVFMKCWLVFSSQNQEAHINSNSELRLRTLHKLHV